MSELLTSWRDSLAIFKPSSFKLFALVTIKAVYDSFGAFVRTGAIAVCLLPSILQYIIRFMAMRELSCATGWCYSALAAVVAVTIDWTLLIIVRPSVEQKNVSYLLHRFWRYAIIILCWVPLVIGKIELQPYTLIANALFDPWLAVLGLFILDAPATLRGVGSSIYRSLLMMIYNAPFWMAFVLFAASLLTLNNLVARVVDRLFAFVYASYGQVAMIPLMVAWMVWVIGGVYLLLFCVMANFYTKRIHEQPQLYLGS